MRRRRRVESASDSRRDWMIAVEAIVADVNDPEGMHRIRVIIPSVDEDRIHDEWVTALVPWVGPAGYGPVNLPAVDTEVLLFGRLGEKHTLFYLSRYNEDFSIPGGFVSDAARGLKTDGRYKLLADLLIEVISLVAVEITAPDVRLESAGGVSVHGQGNKVGFLGAAPAARQQLPPDAVDLETCKTLCNALKHLVAITFGFAE